MKREATVKLAVVVSLLSMGCGMGADVDVLADHLSADQALRKKYRDAGTPNEGYCTGGGTMTLGTQTFPVPKACLTYPLGQTVSGTIMVNVTASSPNGIDRIQLKSATSGDATVTLQLDLEQPASGQTSASASFPLDTTRLPNGPACINFGAVGSNGIGTGAGGCPAMTISN